MQNMLLCTKYSADQKKKSNLLKKKTKKKTYHIQKACCPMI